MPKYEVQTIVDKSNVLTEITEEVKPEEINDKFREFLEDLHHTMIETKGMGIAAPQIGISKRICIVDVGVSPRVARERGLDPEANPEILKSEPVFLINPEIVYKSEETMINEEGCLSLPGAKAKVKRPKEVTVRYLDQDGQLHEKTIEGGLESACYQHEIDHLFGVLYIDYLSPEEKKEVVTAVEANISSSRYTDLEREKLKKTPEKQRC